MHKTLESGIIAGLVGIMFMCVSVLIFFSDWFRVGNSQLSIFFLIDSFALAFLVPGVLAGILAFPSIKTAWGSFLPGLIAGFVALAIPLFLFLLLILQFVYQGLSGDSMAWEYLGHTLPFLLLILVGIGVASLCSALSAAFIFFRHELSRAGTVPEKTGDLESLDTLYDELWDDARTLAADMNQSIAVYRIAGLFMVISGIVLLAFAIAGWLRELAGGYSSFEFIFTIAATICGPAELIIGPYLLSWYNKLRNRYARLASLEKAAGD